MSLLPHSHTQFQLQSYWEQFFSKRSTPFEWYGQYTDLCHILHKYVKTSSKTLVVGCGNSTLSENLYDAGIHDIINIDISEVVVKKMAARNFEKRPKMSFAQMDMLEMSFDNGSFDCIIDKGTLDAIYSNTDDVTVTKVGRMWDEIGRVLKTGGRYMCITLAQQHILSSLLQRFSSGGWLLRTHKVLLSSSGESSERDGIGASLPVIVFILTKMLSLPNKPLMKVMEVVSEEGKCVRCDDVEGVRQFVIAAQQHAMLLHHLKSVHPGEPGIEVQYWTEDIPDVPRYTFTIVDIPRLKAKNGLFAIFIVPQGREGEWIFSSEGGLKGLAEQSCYHRLVVVTMHVGHCYGDLQQVKHEVSGSALAMLQTGVPPNLKLPILSTGEGVGRRVCLCEGDSSVSGRWRVEECGGAEEEEVEEKEEEGEGQRVRRLVFVKTSHLVQTEMRMRPGAKLNQKKRKKKSKKASYFSAQLYPDPSYLMFTHHRIILAALCLTPAFFQGKTPDISEGRGGGGGGCRGGVKGRILVIGLGGGALPTFIHRYLPQVCLEVCELDPDIVNVAEKWFEFQRADTTGAARGVTVHVEDGVSFVKRTASSRDEWKKKEGYSAIVLDVDSKDLSSGISSPPPAFVDQSFLTAARSVLTEDGVLVTNIAARNEDKKIETLYSLQQVFCTLVCIPIQEDVNDIVIGTKQCSRCSTLCSNKFCTQSHNHDINSKHDVVKTEPTGAENTATLTENKEPAKDMGFKESLEEAKRNLLPMDATTQSKWKSTRVEECEGTKGRLGGLVRIITENGGDVKGLETEVNSLVLYKTL